MSRPVLSRRARISLLAASLAVCVTLMGASKGSITRLTLNPNAPVVDLFEGVDNDQFDVRLVAQNAHEGKIFITNKTDKPLTVAVPKGVVGVQVLPQLNGLGNGGGFLGQGAGLNNGLGAGGMGQGGLAQNIGGNTSPIGQTGFPGGNGFPGGGGGNQFPGGGNIGFFSVPPEKTVQIGLNSICLNYGRREPHAGMKYQLVKADSYTTDPVLQQLLEDYNPSVNRGAQQAAAWHLTNGLSWEQLAQLTDQKVPGNPVPLFNPQQLQGARTLVDQAKKQAASRPAKPAESARSVVLK